jgi:preprotein translocase subunit SecG
MALVCIVLIQRSEGGGMGVGGGGLGGMISVRGTANLLTRVTAVLAICFMFTSIILAIIAGVHQRDSSIGTTFQEHPISSSYNTTNPTPVTLMQEQSGTT